MAAYVTLRGFPHPIQGVLSTTPEGTLRMLSPAQAPNPNGRPGRPVAVLVEQFFGYEDVVSIAVTRDVKTEEQPLIVTAS